MKSVKLLKCLIVFAAVAAAGAVAYKIWPEKKASPKIIAIHSRGLTFQEETRDENAIHGTTVDIHALLKVIIIDGGAEYATTTDAVTVNDLLVQKKIPLAATDRITPPLGSFLTGDLSITIDRIVDVEETTAADIPFKIELVPDASVYYGRELAVQAGVLGRKEQKFLVTYKNGVEVRRKLLAEKILQKPQTEIRQFGTLIEVYETTEGGASWYDYKKCLCAAAPYYSRGRYVRVTSLASGKSIIVRINDSGPDTTLYPDRVIDLDIVAYKELAPLGSGTIWVRVELLKND